MGKQVSVHVMQLTGVERVLILTANRDSKDPSRRVDWRAVFCIVIRGIADQGRSGVKVLWGIRIRSRQTCCLISMPRASRSGHKVNCSVLLSEVVRMSGSASLAMHWSLQLNRVAAAGLDDIVKKGKGMVTRATLLPAASVVNGPPVALHSA